MAVIRTKITRTDVRRGGLKGLVPDIKRGANDGLKAIGSAMLAYLKKGIQRGPKTGVTYQKYNPRRQHQASSPGEFPATDTGQLVNSAYQDHDEQDFYVDIGLEDPKAKHLEYGTRHMGKRPMIAPTIKAFRKRIPNIMKRAIQARLK